MAVERFDLELRYSGGAGNVSGASALGGVMSTSQIDRQVLAFQGAGVSGVSLAFGDGHNEIDGNLGRVVFTQATSSLQWIPPQNSPVVAREGPLTSIPADGRYALPDGSGETFVIVDAVFANLPPSDTQDDVLVADHALDTFWPNISAAETVSGVARYRCRYLYNANPVDTIASLSVFRSRDTDGDDVYTLGLDPAGVGDGVTTGVATTIATEIIAPTGITFSAPTLAAPLLTPPIPPLNGIALWGRIISPANATPINPNRMETGILIAA